MVKQVLRDNVNDIEATITRLESAPSTAGALPEDIQSLGVRLAPPSPGINAARQKIEAEIEFACSQYDQIFHRGVARARPKLQIITPDSHNSFYLPERDQIFTPALAADIPDMVYRESAHAYLMEAGLGNIGASGTYAIESSYGDVLALWLKQKKVSGISPESQWILYEGAVAWILGGDPRTDRRPLRSFKSPGSAYKNAGVLGDDMQLERYSGGATKDPNAASGISNKAFYETATRLDSDRAVRIWIAALPALSKKLTFQTLATATAEAARSIFGADGEAKVREAWHVVGL